MFSKLNEKRAQSTLEYAILIVIVIGALISIQMYVKRGLQGRMRSASDDIGNQFSPGNMRHLAITDTVSSSTDTFSDGQSRSVIGGEENAEISAPAIVSLNAGFLPEDGFLSFNGAAYLNGKDLIANVQQEQVKSRMQEEIIDVEQEYFGCETNEAGDCL